MKLLCVYLLAVVSVLLMRAIPVAGQPFYFRHYQVENGLSNNTVNCIIQDKRGFMWFATKDGLNRFDGQRFKTFHVTFTSPEKNLETNYIHNLYADEDGTVWVGTISGLYRFNPANEMLEPFAEPAQNIFCINKDRQGKLWFIADQTLCRFDVATNKLYQYPPGKFFNCTSLCIGNEGSVWAASNNGLLYRYLPQTDNFTSFNLFAHSPEPTSRWIQKIKPGKEASIFVGTSSQGLKVFDTGTGTYADVLTSNPDQTNIFVRDILKTGASEYWIATESGIFIYNTNTGVFKNLKKKYSDPNSLNDNAVYTLYRDRENGIWAGTFFGGVNYYAAQNAAFIKYYPDNTSNSISGNAVRGICEDEFGHLWVGTEDGGLNKITKRTGQVQRFMPSPNRQSIAYSNIHGLLAVGNRLWIGTFENGIDVMDINTGKVVRHYTAGTGKNQLKSNFGLCFLKTASGSLLVGTSSGLYTFNPKTEGFERSNHIPGDYFILALMQDHYGNIWMATSNSGIYWYNEVTGKKGHYENDPTNSNSLSSNAISDVFEDSRHFIWMACEGGGISRFNPANGQFNNYTVSNGLPSNFIFKILEDNRHTLWASTSKGLVSFKADFEDLKVYTTANGLLNDQFNYTSGYKDHEGRLYFGSVKGMISFRPENFLPNRQVPPIYITGMQVFNQELPVNGSEDGLKQSIILTDKVTLPHSMSSISIDFAALSYIAPSMTEYYYTLDGLDNEWVHLPTNRKVYFTNLTPGKYVFKVKAFSNGIPASAEKKLFITILPPFWATPWAYAFYILVAAIALYYAVREYHRRHQTKKEKEIYESKIEFFTNVAHEIRTPLTLIKGPVENLMEREHELPEMDEDLACLDRNTNRLMDLVTQILDFRQTEIKGFSLEFSRVNMKDLVQEIFLSFKILAKKKHQDFILDLPPGDAYIMADKEALQKIISNLVGNAVKYAETYVKVWLQPVDTINDQVNIVFQNDGPIIPREMEDKIFEPFYRMAETKMQKGTGIGLTLAKSLTVLHGGSLQLVFTNKDLNTFILRLPVKSTTSEKPGTIPNKKSLQKT